MAHSPIDQRLLTVLVPVRQDQVRNLQDLLKQLALELPPHVPIGKQSRLDFAEMGTIHFARFLVLEKSEDAEGQPTPPQLLLSLVHDGPRRDFVRAWVARSGKILQEIYEHCENAPSPADLEEYLLKHVNEPAAFFVSARWRPVEMVQGEQALRLELEDELDELQAAERLSEDPWATHARLRKAVADSDLFRWALEPAPTPGLAFKIPHYALKALILGVGLVTLPVTLPALIILLVCIRVAEIRDQRGAVPNRGPTVKEAPAVAEKVERLLKYSGFFVQNQLSIVSKVKPGRLRWLVLRIVILYLKYRMAYLDVHGKLNGLPSVHFAHWNLIDGGRRLLFLTNYDGTWEAYLGDFVDFAHKGLNAIWSNTEDYPPTKWLAFEGASSAQRMSAYVGSQQVDCQLWWAAYPSLSVLNVLNDAQMREGLADTQNPDVATWLMRF